MTEAASEAGTLPPIYTRVEQNPAAVELLDGGTELVAHAQKYAVIETDEVASVAAEYLARNRKHVKLLDAERLDMTAGARSTIERINTKFNAEIDALRAKDKLVDGALKTYWRRKADEASAAAAAARAQQEAHKASGDNGPLPPAIVVPPPPAKTIHGSYGSKATLRDNWKWRVVDIAKVADSYLVAPEDRIRKSVMNAAVKSRAKERLADLAREGAETPSVLTVPDLPGIEMYNDPTTSTSTF